MGNFFYFDHGLSFVYLTMFSFDLNSNAWTHVACNSGPSYYSTQWQLYPTSFF